MRLRLVSLACFSRMRQSQFSFKFVVKWNNFLLVFIFFLFLFFFVLFESLQQQSSWRDLNKDVLPFRVRKNLYPKHTIQAFESEFNCLLEDLYGIPGSFWNGNNPKRARLRSRPIFSDLSRPFWVRFSAFLFLLKLFWAAARNHSNCCSPIQILDILRVPRLF